MRESQFHRPGAVIIGEKPRVRALVESVAARAMFDSMFGPEAKAAEARRRVNALRKECGVGPEKQGDVLTLEKIHAVLNAIEDYKS